MLWDWIWHAWLCFFHVVFYVRVSAFWLGFLISVVQFLFFIGKVLPNFSHFSLLSFFIFFHQGILRTFWQIFFWCTSFCVCVCRRGGGDWGFIYYIDFRYILFISENEVQRILGYHCPSALLVPLCEIRSRLAHMQWIYQLYHQDCKYWWRAIPS